MVATRRRRVPAVVPESSASPEPSVRDIDVEPQALRSATVASASAQSSPTASPSPALSPTMPTDGRSTRSHSNQSATSFAGPGQRGAQLLSVAPSSARFSYLNAFENMNDEFATQLRARGVALPGGKPEFFSSFQWSQTSGGTHLPRWHPSSEVAFWFPTHPDRLHLFLVYAFAFVFPTHSRSLAYAFALAA